MVFVKLSIALCIFACTLPLRAESFDQFAKQRKADIKKFAEDDQNAFKAWQLQKDRLFSAWQKEALKYKGTTTRSISIKRSAGVIVKEDLDQTKGQIAITLAAQDKDSATAVANARKQLKVSLLQTIKKADPEAVSRAPAKSIALQINATAATALLYVEKKNGSFVASAVGTQNLTGEGSLMSIIAPGVLHATDAGTTPEKKPLPPTGDPVDNSSIIVDSRELDYSTCLIPSFIDPQGNVLYGPQIVFKEFAINGMAQWVRTPDEANALALSGPKPRLFTPVSKTGRRLSFSAAQSAQLKQISEQSAILRECKVIIIVK